MSLFGLGCFALFDKGGSVERILFSFGRGTVDLLEIFDVPVDVLRVLLVLTDRADTECGGS